MTVTGAHDISMTKEMTVPEVLPSYPYENNKNMLRGSASKPQHDAVTQGNTQSPSASTQIGWRGNVATNPMTDTPPPTTNHSPPTTYLPPTTYHPPPTYHPPSDISSAMLSSVSVATLVTSTITTLYQ